MKNVKTCNEATVLKNSARISCMDCSKDELDMNCDLHWLHKKQDNLVNNDITYNFGDYFNSLPSPSISLSLVTSKHQINKTNFYNKASFNYGIDFNDFSDLNMYELETDSCRPVVDFSKPFNTTYICSKCTKIFSSEEGIRYHMSTVHKPLNPQCLLKPVKNICFNSSSTGSLSKIHSSIDFKSIKTKKEYRCLECKKIYKNHNGLKYHKQKYHPQEIIKKV